MDEKIYLTYSGAPVKSMGGGRVSGRIVTFSSAHDPDRSGEFFTAATDFWLSGNGERRPILYRHGLDGSVKRRRFGEVQITRAADGLWCTGTVNGRDEHATKMLDMAEAGLLNWSTGSVGHLVETTPVGRAKHVDSWPLSEVSLCPHTSVAEPRNILSLKSLCYDNVPDFDDLEVPLHHQKKLEQRAWQIYAETIISGYELRMQGLIT